MQPIKQITYTAIQGIPIVSEGDNLALFIYENFIRQGLGFLTDDIVVITQKIVSKAEGRLVDLRTVKPSLKARQIAKFACKDPRLVELILSESQSVLRVRKGLIIVEHKNGFICANAGIDHSNSVNGTDAENFVLLLPKDADNSASQIRSVLKELTHIEIGILIIDSHGRAWRNGTIGTTVGISGIPGLVDLRGQEDLFGYKLRVTQVAAADELAAGASLLMGQADESIPCVHVRGFPYVLRDSNLVELIRKKKSDLFR